MTEHPDRQDDAIVHEHELATWETPPLPDDFEDRLMAKLGRAGGGKLRLASQGAASPRPSAAVPTPERNGLRPTYSSSWAPSWWLAAAAALLVGGGVLYAMRSGDRDAGQVVDARVAGAGVEVEPEDGALVDWDGIGGSATQQRGRARYRVRPGTAFVVKTAAANVTVKGTEFTVEVLEMNARTKRTLKSVGALALGGAAVAVYVHSGSVDVSNVHGSITVTAGQRAMATETAAPRRTAEPGAKASKGDPKVAKRAKRGKTRRLDTEERRRVEQQILEVVGAAPPRSTSRPAPDEASDPGDEPRGTLDKEYIRTIIREEMVPLAKECYEAALADDPELAGRISLKFDIAGDESVGGIVETVELGEDSTITEPGMVECISESTKSLLFDPPDGGGRVTVIYPIIFQAEPDPGDASNE